MLFDPNKDSSDMIEKNVQGDGSLNNVECVRLISEKIKSLDQASSQIQDEIKNCFERLESALKTRKRRLIRQVEAIHRQQLSLVQSNLELLPSIPPLTLDLNSEAKLEEQILNFGSIELSDGSIAVNDSEPFRIVDYQEANEDHINFDKSLQLEETEFRKKYDLSLKTPLKLNVSDFCKSTSSTEKPLRIVGNVEADELSGCDTRFVNFAGEDLEISEESPQDQSSGENDLFVEDCTKELKSQDFTSMDKSEHPVQIRQWLQQILVETETEPVVHEIGHFSGLARSDLSLET